MNSWIMLQIYAIIALSLGWTSYLNIFRPAISLLEEITEEKSNYGGIFGFILWTFFASLGAPITLIVLLNNDNEQFIQLLAAKLAEEKLEDE